SLFAWTDASEILVARRRAVNGASREAAFSRKREDDKGVPTAGPGGSSTGLAVRRTARRFGYQARHRATRYEDFDVTRRLRGLHQLWGTVADRHRRDAQHHDADGGHRRRQRPGAVAAHPE